MLLREKDKERLINFFSHCEIPIEVWAYGSRVNGTAHDSSDLDLVVRTPNLTPLPYSVFNDLRRKIQDSNIPILVELMDWARLPESFHTNILEQYEVLYDSRLLQNENAL